MNEEYNKDLEDSVAGNMLYNFCKDMVLRDEGSRKVVEAIQRYGLTEKQSILLFHEITNISTKYSQ